MVEPGSVAAEDDANNAASASHNAVFINTNLNTNLALVVSHSDTVYDLKNRILVEHPHCFPNIGEIKIHALKVKRKGFFYHLTDSMLVRSAFDGVRKNWFLWLDASNVTQQSEPCFATEDVSDARGKLLLEGPSRRSNVSNSLSPRLGCSEKHRPNIPQTSQSHVAAPILLSNKTVMETGGFGDNYSKLVSSDTTKALDPIFMNPLSMVPASNTSSSPAMIRVLQQPECNEGQELVNEDTIFQERHVEQLGSYKDCTSGEQCQRSEDANSKSGSMGKEDQKHRGMKNGDFVHKRDLKENHGSVSASLSIISPPEKCVANIGPGIESNQKALEKVLPSQASSKRKHKSLEHNVTEFSADVLLSEKISGIGKKKRRNNAKNHSDEVVSAVPSAVRVVREKDSLENVPEHDRDLSVEFDAVNMPPEPVQVTTIGEPSRVIPETKLRNPILEVVGDTVPTYSLGVHKKEADVAKLETNCDAPRRKVASRKKQVKNSKGHQAACVGMKESDVSNLESNTDACRPPAASERKRVKNSKGHQAAGVDVKESDFANLETNSDGLTPTTRSERKRVSKSKEHQAASKEDLPAPSRIDFSECRAAKLGIEDVSRTDASGRNRVKISNEHQADGKEDLPAPTGVDMKQPDIANLETNSDALRPATASGRKRVKNSKRHQAAGIHMKESNAANIEKASLADDPGRNRVKISKEHQADGKEDLPAPSGVDMKQPDIANLETNSDALRPATASGRKRVKNSKRHQAAGIHMKESNAANIEKASLADDPGRKLVKNSKGHQSDSEKDLPAPSGVDMLGTDVANLENNSEALRPATASGRKQVKKLKEHQSASEEDPPAPSGIDMKGCNAANLEIESDSSKLGTKRGTKRHHTASKEDLPSPSGKDPLAEVCPPEDRMRKMDTPPKTTKRTRLKNSDSRAGPCSPLKELVRGAKKPVSPDGETRMNVPKENIIETKSKTMNSASGSKMGQPHKGTGDSSTALLQESSQKNNEPSTTPSSIFEEFRGLTKGNKMSKEHQYHLAKHPVPGRNSSIKKIEEVTKSEPKSRLMAKSGGIFSGSSESSKDEGGSENSFLVRKWGESPNRKLHDTSTRTSSDYSSSSGYSEGASSSVDLHPRGVGVGLNENRVKNDNRSISEDAENISMNTILKSSSRYKKVKLTASQLQFEDSESQPIEFVPDSLPYY